jgi:hypothetical protein
MLYAPSELPYDITYTTDLNEYEWYLVSDYNKDTESEHDCMVAYLKDKFTSKPKRYKFPRICDITGEGFNDGYCIGDGEMYIKYEKDLVAHLRSLEDDTDLSDDFLLDEAYKLGYYYYSDWDIEENEWYETASEEGIGAYLVKP